MTLHRSDLARPIPSRSPKPPLIYSLIRDVEIIDGCYQSVAFRDGRRG